MVELFEALTLVQTRKVTSFPIVLLGAAYWSGLVEWLRTTMVEQGKASPADLDLFKLTDSPAEAVEAIKASSGRRDEETAAFVQKVAAERSGERRPEA